MLAWYCISFVPSPPCSENIMSPLMVDVFMLNTRLIQVCVQPRPLAVNMALPTFAAERRAAGPCYCNPVALPATGLCQSCCSAHDGTDKPSQTDRETNGHRTVTYRPCSAYYAGSANNTERGTAKHVPNADVYY